MTFSVVLNGNTYNDASFNGNNYAIPATGLPAVMQDFVQHGANLWQASSGTSLSITGSGPVSLMCTLNRPFLIGATIRLQRVSDTTAYMQGPITAWNPATGALTFTSNTSSNGLGSAGPWTDWQILALGLQGATGAAGATFTGGTVTTPIVASATAFNEASATLASAATVNIGAAAGNYIFLTGTTTVTAFDTVQSGTYREIECQGAITFTHNATTLILPGAVNYTAAAGDVLGFRSEGSGNWRCVFIQQGNGGAVFTGAVTHNGTMANNGATVLNGATQIKQVKATKTAPAISTSTLTLDLSTGSDFAVALNANITALTISNPAASGLESIFFLTFTADGTARSVTWPGSVKWPGGTAPTLTSTNGKVDEFCFKTFDGGTTYYASIVGQNS
jgi:hypothetical protein